MQCSFHHPELPAGLPAGAAQHPAGPGYPPGAAVAVTAPPGGSSWAVPPPGSGWGCSVEYAVAQPSWGSASYTPQQQHCGHAAAHAQPPAGPAASAVPGPSMPAGEQAAAAVLAHGIHHGCACWTGRVAVMPPAMPPCMPISEPHRIVPSPLLLLSLGALFMTLLHDSQLCICRRQQQAQSGACRRLRSH